MKSNIDFPELEAELKAGTESSNQKVRNDASADGKRHLPGADDDLEFFFESHHHAYNKLIALIYSTTQMGSKCLTVLESGQLYLETHLKLDNRERMAKDRLVDIKQSLKSHRSTTDLHWIYLCISLLLGLFDGIFNQPFFEFKGAMYWQSFVCSLIFGGVIFTVAHFVIPAIRSIKDVEKRKLYLASACLGMFFLFVYMAHGRVEAIGGHSLTSKSQALGYALASMFMFGVACFMSHLYHKQRSNKPMVNTGRHEELKAELKTLEKELNAIYKEREELTQKEKEEREYARALFEYASGLRQRIIEEARQSFFEYKKINRLNRTDGIIPDCLLYTEYPFSFTTFVELSNEQPPFKRTAPVTACILAMILGLSSCTFSSEKIAIDASHIVMIDTTDPLLVYPDSVQIGNLVGLENNIWQGVELSFGVITDMDVNPIQTITLPKKNRITGNLQKRQELVSLFIQEQFDLIDASRPKGHGTLGHSIVYRTLARQLAVLADRPAKIKNLVVYSNLYENSDLANFYDNATFKKLQDNTKEIQQKFEHAVQLGDLTGITIWFVYQPESYEDNLRYITVSNFFKNMFQEHVATVHVVATL